MIGWLDENTNEINSGMAVLHKQEMKEMKLKMRRAK